MRKNLILTVFCVTALVAYSNSNAGISRRWPPSVGSRDVYVYSGMPAICDNQVLYALNTWNQAGARFAYGWPSSYLTSFREADQSESFDNATVTVEDGPIPERPSALMATYSTKDINGYLEDVDIAVNDTLLLYSGQPPGEFFCSMSSTEPSPPDRYDFRTLIQHEFGHGIGFLDYTDPNYYFYCSMFSPRGKGEMQRYLCQSEYDEFRAVYGLR